MKSSTRPVPRLRVGPPPGRPAEDAIVALRALATTSLGRRIVLERAGELSPPESSWLPSRSRGNAGREAHELRMTRREAGAYPCIRGGMRDQTGEQGAGHHDAYVTRPSTIDAAHASISGARDANSATAVARGASIGRYLILGLVGHGGMGEVYAAYDPELDRRVALKLLFTRHGSDVARSRLIAEARALGRLSHPNVVQVHDVGEHLGNVFVAMELIEGESLAAWCGRSPRPPFRAVLAAYLEAARGLSAAHEKGLVHRDVKPDNLMRGKDGRVRVVDFGLAAGGEDVSPPASERASAPESAPGLPTAPGAVAGTPIYMAPEQHDGARVSAASDQFSFCVALYEALYGAPPFGVEPGLPLPERLAQLRDQKRRRELPPPIVPSAVPTWVRAALLRGLAPEPAGRYPSIDALVAALADDPDARRRTRMRAVGVTVVVATITAGILAVRPRPAAPCRGAAAALQPIWSAARAADLARVFDASGSATAPDVFARTRAVLDRYAAAWVDAHTSACEATHVRGEQSGEALDLRMACLQQRSKELGATVDLYFRRTDGQLLSTAVEAAARLTPIDTCSDVAALRAPFAPPRDDTQRRAVEELRRKLVDVQALERAGLWAEALGRATPLVEEATRTGYAPLKAEVLLCKGDAEYHLEKPELLQSRLEAALEAEASRHDAIAAEAWTSLAKESAVVKDDFARAALYAQIADAAVRRARDDEVLRANLLAARGWIAYRQSDQRAARAFAEQALEIRSRVLGPSHPMTLTARSDLADRLFDDGAIEDALAMDEALYRDRVALLGEAHPSAVRTLGDLAQVKTELGDYASGAELAERAVALASTPLRAADARLYRANALLGSGRVAEAVALFEEGIALVRAKRGPKSLLVGGDYVAFAQALVQREMFREARANADLAIDILATADREGDRGLALAIRALCKARGGDAPGAIADADAMLAFKVKFLGPRADLIPLLARGEALLSLNRGGDALGDLERALAIGNTHRGDAAIRAEIAFGVARALRAAGRERPRTIDLATHAAEALARAGLESAARRVRDWLAANP